MERGQYGIRQHVCRGPKMGPHSRDCSKKVFLLRVGTFAKSPMPRRNILPPVKLHVLANGDEFISARRNEFVLCFLHLQYLNFASCYICTEYGRTRVSTPRVTKISALYRHFDSFPNTRIEEVGGKENYGFRQVTASSLQRKSLERERK